MPRLTIESNEFLVTVRCSFPALISEIEFVDRVPRNCPVDSRSK